MTQGLAAAVIIKGTGELKYASTRYGTRSFGTNFLTGSVPTEVLEAIRRARRP